MLFYAWQHFECIQIRYQMEQLESQRAQAVELNQQLHLEVATLRSPDARGFDCAESTGLDGSGAGQVAPVGGSERCGAGASARLASCPALKTSRP